MLKLSVLGSAALLLPLQRTAKTQLSIADRIPESLLPKPFEVPFGIPPALKPVKRTKTTDFYRMTMKQGHLPILPGFPKTEVWGYNGITPGPTIVAKRGRKVVVRHINQIQSPDHRWTSVHLHGNASLPQYDGYASDIIEPGEYKDYRYPNEQDARTLWYHDHGVHDTALNAYMGCAAFYITHDEQEMSLPIPHGRYDVPLVLRDAIFAKNGQLIFDDGSSRGGHDSLFGDVILANGRPWPVMKVERRKYRFRFLNASISRGFRLQLSTGEPMTIIGHDGGLAPTPVEVQSFCVGMAERYEVVIDFAKYPVGTQVTLQNLGLENNMDFAQTGVVMRFDVTSEAKDNRNNSIPEVLNPNSEVMHLQETGEERKTHLRLERQGGEWTVNGRTWHDVEESDFKEVVANPMVGEQQVWELENTSGGWFHPLHIHLVDFKILDRNGQPPLPYEVGPKDTAYIGENETVRVLARFGPHEGRYMVHCHNLVHEDHDMMVQYAVGDPRANDPVSTAPAVADTAAWPAPEYERFPWQA